MSKTQVDGDTLAIHGGAPVRSTYLPYGRPSVGEEDIEAVVKVLRSDWLTTGPTVREFEAAVAAYVGAEHGVAFSSGTAALHGAAFAAGLGLDDEAITTPLTFAATANCVLYMGARPVFGDISPDTMNLDPTQIEERITSRTKAILPVDYAGHPVDLDAILRLAEKNNLVVIEDAAHALGAEYRERKVGSQSHMTIFSFHPVKHLTTGEGGMVTTNNPDLARKLRSFRNHGIDLESEERQGQEEGDWYYEMRALGYNYRLTDIGSGLGLAQLDRLPENLTRRRELAGFYGTEFKSMPEIITQTQRPEALNSWHIYPIRLELDLLTTGRKDIFQALRAENIGVNVHYIPVHLHPYYQQRFGHRRGEYPVAENTYDRLITLPMFPGMSDQDAADVVRAVKRTVAHYRRGS